MITNRVSENWSITLIDQNQLQSLIRGVLKLAAGYLLAHGVHDGVLADGALEVLSGSLASSLLLWWGCRHQTARTLQAQPIDQKNNGPV